MPLRGRGGGEEREREIDVSVCLGAEKGERRFEYKEGRERGEMGNLQRLLLQNGGPSVL